MLNLRPPMWDQFQHLGYNLNSFCRSASDEAIGQIASPRLYALGQEDNLSFHYILKAL